MKPKLACVVGTAYHVLSATELRHALDISPDHCALVVLDRNSTIIRQQIGETAQMLGWKSVTVIPLHETGSMGSNRRSSSLRAAVQQILDMRSEIASLAPESLAVGAHQALISELRRHKGINQFFILDDGSFNLWLHDRLWWQRRAGLKSTVFSWLLAAQLSFYRRTIPGSTGVPESPTWFTALELEQTARGPIWKHDFAYLRQSFVQAPVCPELGIIVGRPSGNANDDAYAEAIGRFTEYFGSIHFSFFPHTGTSQEVVERVRKMGVKIGASRTALEIELAGMAPKPATIAEIGRAHV